MTEVACIISLAIDIRCSTAGKKSIMMIYHYNKSKIFTCLEVFPVSCNEKIQFPQELNNKQLKTVFI